MTTKENILVIGACGQLGTELTVALRNIYGEHHVVATDIHCADPAFKEQGIFEELNAMDGKKMAELVNKYQITQIYHLAAMLSAKGEQNPLFAWKLNMESLLNVLEIAREKQLNKIYFPSSIGVFGFDTPKQNTPQQTIINPTTVYGISKQAGEHWCNYYFDKFGVDARCLRYPGLISYNALPGGGTTDYAVDIFYKALENNAYECFLSEDTYLPMMYMPDAVKGTLDLMHAPANQIKTRTGYNLAAISFSPKEITQAIQKHIPAFTISYKPDGRQQIADSWPDSIDDTQSRQDWGWQHQYNLATMVEDMLVNLKKKVVLA
ncbi:NAD-dependent epimerase/dehydratase family protein [Microscilla marina]|uniref:L-threonine dehydrogenase n=1 Tax=Microscilla marina ATCC 23134 TaxID=313606 RepID=A1ZN38_MICM2|nr:NAD-dependent epimerase/dehydratase family protein [Microscilla marina]EAY28219.1 L-threonine dehydrogenase [Microscilla marina ATCC 23134]